MSDSRAKYDELVEAGKINPCDTVAQLNIIKKERNIRNVIQLARTAVKHNIDFEITSKAISLIQENPLLTELQAIEIAMHEFGI